MDIIVSHAADWSISQAKKESRSYLSLMIFKRLYDEYLAQASYLVACERTRQAIVIDPSREIEKYLAAAEDAHVRIAHVTETHVHADYLSGSRELARKTKAALYLSGHGGKDWSYEFATEPGIKTVRDGDVISAGSLRIQVMHTPGHTPEHISFLVTDTTISESPIGAMTGDFIFVSEVGRPDLLERAAGVAGTMRESAETLFDSIQRFSALPDYLQIWPGHGAGSACGKSLGAMPQSTLGFEKLTNWAFNVSGRDEFVSRVLEGQPDPPVYFAEMKRINRAGPPMRPGRKSIPEISDTKLGELLESGAQIIDTRPAPAFVTGFLRGTVNVPFNKSFLNWAGSVVPYDRDFYLIVESPEEERISEIRKLLLLIGLDRLGGYASVAALERLSAAGHNLGIIPEVPVEQLQDSNGALVLDVRTTAEWTEGHIKGAKQIALQSLAQRLPDIDRATPIIVHCQGGTRSTIAASVLAARGFTNVRSAPGGFGEYEKKGLPVKTES